MEKRRATGELDSALHAMGFEFDDLSPYCVAGHLVVNPTCCQPFKVLHGGVSALIAEALASMGAHLACGLQRVAGINLSINHLKSARLGELVCAQASPVHLGRIIQVWDVQLWKQESSNMKKNKTLISIARVTLVCNLPVPDHAKHFSDTIRKYAKL